MKNQIQQFHSDEFGSIEILMIGGKPYFPAAECAVLLGYSKPHKTVTVSVRGDGSGADDAGVENGSRRDCLACSNSLREYAAYDGESDRLFCSKRQAYVADDGFCDMFN